MRGRGNISPPCIVEYCPSRLRDTLNLAIAFSLESANSCLFAVRTFYSFVIWSSYSTLSWLNIFIVSSQDMAKLDELPEFLHGLLLIMIWLFLRRLPFRIFCLSFEAVQYICAAWKNKLWFLDRNIVWTFLTFCSFALFSVQVTNQPAQMRTLPHLSLLFPISSTFLPVTMHGVHKAGSFKRRPLGVRTPLL